MNWASTLPLATADEDTARKVRELAAPITDETGVSLEVMLGRSHLARVAKARHRLFAAMWRVGFSMSEIGRVTGRNHATVIVAVRNLVGPEQYKVLKVQNLAAKLGVAS